MDYTLEVLRTIRKVQEIAQVYVDTETGRASAHCLQSAQRGPHERLHCPPGGIALTYYTSDYPALTAWQVIGTVLSTVELVAMCMKDRRMVDAYKRSIRAALELANEDASRLAMAA
jgi:hypothetical protein